MLGGGAGRQDGPPGVAGLGGERGLVVAVAPDLDLHLAGGDLRRVLGSGERGHRGGGRRIFSRDPARGTPRRGSGAGVPPRGARRAGGVCLRGGGSSPARGPRGGPGGGGGGRGGFSPPLDE